MEKKLDIMSMSLLELNSLMLNIGENKYRGKQIYAWLHSKSITSFFDMTNISKALQIKLARKCYLPNLKEIDRLISKKDETVKYLFELEDQNVIETVLMQYEHGSSVCISSQVGCRMGCKFCASTIGGLVRNLTCSEMLEQVYMIRKTSNKKVSNIVIMGMGEPLDNYDATISFMRIISSVEGMNISQRNITLSTCGIIDRINDLSMEGLKITLAISLHASNDAIRKKIMPIAYQSDYNTLLRTCNDYANLTKRRITFEYSLIKGINDTNEAAVELGYRLKGILCHVNLIPINNIEESNYRHSKKETINKFKSILEKRNISVTVRRELGTDINAACGQLRRRHITR